VRGHIVLGQIHGLDQETEFLYVIVAEHTTQVGNLLNIDGKADMKKKLESGFEFVTVGGKSATCVSVITQDLIT
jgi:hypothetical protein